MKEATTTTSASGRRFIDMPMLSTIQKVRIAGALLSVLLFLRRCAGLGTVARVRRRGIRWQLDLTEAVDFSIYLIGVFERETAAVYSRYVRPGSIVLDIGANVGAHTLPLSRLVGPQGRVFAFEPTVYAYGKLKANLELNPDLAGRAECIQAMLVAESGEQVQTEVYSSWPLVPDTTPERHPLHCGKLMSAEGASAITLDSVIAKYGIAKVDFVKIDVDGNEWKVVSGGRKLFERDRPVLLIEFASYLFDSCFWEFEALIQFLAKLGYRFVDAQSGVVYPADSRKIREMIPEGFSRNVIASAGPQAER